MIKRKKKKRPPREHHHVHGIRHQLFDDNSTHLPSPDEMQPNFNSLSA